MKNRILRLSITGLLLLSFILPTPVLAARAADVQGPSAATQVKPSQSGAEQPAPPVPSLGGNSHISATASQKATVQPNQPARRVYGETDPSGTVAAVYIVQLLAPPLASYRGGINGLQPTSPAVTSAAMDVNSSASSAYLGYLTETQNAMLANIEQLLGRPVEVKFTYQVAINGFAIVMTPVEAARVVRMDGVQRVQRDALDQLHGWPTEFGAALISAPSVWGGGYQGEGIVAGIIDTGINFASPSFARVGLDGYIHTNPRGGYYGVCDPESEVYSSAFACNDKLIGAWDFSDGLGESPDGPADNDGHGSHTASTVAGNFANGSLVAPTFVYNASVSGVAPHANIIAYDACGLNGCFSSALIASINQAVADNVDVINYSIGGGSRDPWESLDALAFLAALDAGIYVSVSAGNDGPKAGTMSSPANAPWLMAVAASTTERRFTNGLSNMSGGTGAPADMTGQSITSPYGPAKIVYAGNYTSTLGEADPQCLEPFEAETFSGEIVVCDRGGNGRVAKSYNVQAGGAGGYVLANDELSGSSLVADAYAIPGVHITYANGGLLKTWLAGGGNTTATINGTVEDVNSAYADILASFSSRGPDPSQPGVLKPDVSAPGVDIFAAYHTGIEYNVLSGTSMASPHTAGAGALLKEMHPDWSPSEIRSALMLTSMPFLFADETPTLFKDDGVTPADPFDVGAGRIDVMQASRVGFVLDENAYNFEVAEPNAGGDPRTLNLASLADQQCVGVCVWTRTLKSVFGAPFDYTVTTKAPVSMTLSVEPSSFTLQPGGTQVITITANVGAAALDNWLFGRIDVKPTVSAAFVNLSDAHLPVAVYTRAGGAPLGVNEVSIGTRRNQGMATLEGIRAINTPALVKALYVGASETITGFVAEDPTNSDPFDINNGGVFVDLVSITDPTIARFGVSVVDTTAFDLDLYVGIDKNGDGQPSEDELLCTSASASAFEFCVVDEPEVDDYWVLLQNWQGSGAPLDFFAMEYTQVSRSNQSPEFTVSGPASAVLGEPFDLRLTWDFDPMAAGDVRLALLEVGTGPGTASNNILSLPVTLERLSDDVRISVSTPNADDEFALPGDELTYSIRVNPEPTAPNPVSYRVTATVPAGLTYVPGSAVLSSGAQRVTVDPIVVGNQLVWQLNDLANAPDYVMSTNDPESPIYSEECGTPFGSEFLHLEEVGIPLVSSVDGNAKTWSLDALYGPSSPAYNFYGDDYPSLSFTDDALLSVVGYDPALNTGVNAPIPTAARPNALLAPYWADFKVVYNEAAGTGVRIAGSFDDLLMIVEYDGLQRNDAQPGSFDAQAFIIRQPVSSFPEIVFVYDAISGTLPSGVTGVENRDGTDGKAFVGAISDNLLVCYDWTQQPATVSYQAEVKADAPLNTEQATTVSSSISAPGSGIATTQNELFITGVMLEMSVSGPPNMLPSLPVTYTLTVTNAGTVAAQNLTVVTEIPFGTQHVAGGVEEDGLVTFQIPTLAAGASTQLRYSVMLIEEPSPVLAASVRSPAIVGGNPADPGEYPWQVALLSTTYDDQFCGGSLISPWWVATAAHCVDTETERSIYVVVGRTDLSTKDGQEIGVERIAIHPDYDPFILDNDIALLQLSEPAVLTTTVQTIPFAGRLDGPIYGTGVMATVTGWGSRGSDVVPEFPDQLYEVDVPIVDQKACEFAYATMGYAVTSNMLCAGVIEGGKGSCYGDSGGPLIVPNPDGGSKLAGIVSWGITDCIAPGFPGVYTRIGNYTDWIATEQGKLFTGRYFVSDGSGYPGHSYVGSEVVTTLVRQIQQWLVPVSKQYSPTR